MMPMLQHPTNPQRKALFSLGLLVSLMPIVPLVCFLEMRISREPDPEELVRAGRRAAADGDYERAVALYERAELRSGEPAEVAFYLAAAKYRVAAKSESYSADLMEAESLYRCCLNATNPHRPRALCGLGICLLRKADGRDEGSLRAALASFDLSLREAGGDAELIDDVRFNREKARLLLLQFQPPPNDPVGERSSGDDFQPRPSRLDPRQAVPQPAREPNSDGSPDGQPLEGDAKPEPGKEGAKRDEPSQPGKGNLPPIPDEVDVRPLPQRLAEEYLEVAGKKVLQERRTHHRRAEESTAKGVKDW